MLSKSIFHKDFFLFRDLHYWPLPEHISIEITNHCNLRCTHCFQSHFSFPRGDLQPLVWDKLKKELKKFKSVSLSSAGEPLIAKDFENILLYCKTLKLSISITSNAQLLEKKLGLLVGNLTQLSVSLDAISEKEYRKRRKVSPKPVIEALKKLKALKEAKNTPYPFLSLIVVLNRENIYELPLLINFASEVGANTVYAYYQIFYSEDEFREKSLFFTPKEADRFLKKALNLAKKLKIDLIHPGSFDEQIPPHPATANYLSRKNNSFFCHWIFKTATISWNGYVQACCFCDRLFTGKITVEDFEEIWNGPGYRYLRLNFLRSSLPKECKNCQFLQVISLERKSFLCPHREEAFYTDKALIFQKNPLPLKKAETLYQRGIDLIEEEKYEAALGFFWKICQKEPLYFEALNAAGVCLALLGKRDRACEIFKQALNIFPENEIISANLRRLSKN